MSVRVLTILIGFMFVAVDASDLRSSEAIPPGFLIPLTAPQTQSATRDAVSDDPVRDYPAVAESVDRGTRRSSNLRWVLKNEPVEAETPIEPLPQSDAEWLPDVSLVPDDAPWDTPSPTAAPALGSDASDLDLSDASQPAPISTRRGIVQTAPTMVVEIAGPPSTSVGATASFVIYVKNMGSVTADGVTVQAIIPEHVELLGSKPAASLTRKNLLVFEIGDLKSEEVRRIDLNLVPRASGEVRLHTSVGFSVATSSTVQVGTSNLTLHCDAPGVATLGDLVTFQLVVRNSGDVSAKGLVVIPHVSADGRSEMSPMGQFDVGELAPGDSKEILLRATANRIGPMQVRFLATDASGAEATTTTSVRVQSTTMDLSLVVPDLILLGMEQEYEVRVSNSEPTPAGNVRVACSLPTDFRLTVIERSVRFNPDYSVMTWQVGEMAGNETKVLRFKARVGAEGQHKLRAVLESDRLATPRTTEAIIGVQDEPEYQRTASRF